MCREARANYGTRCAIWQAGSELAWLVPQIFCLLHLVFSSWMRLRLCGSAWCRFVHFELARLAAGTTTERILSPKFRKSMPSGPKCNKTWPKAIRNANLVNRYTKSSFYNCSPGNTFFLCNLYLFFDDFVRFRHAELEQSNNGNDRNRRVPMHFRVSGDGKSFLPLQHRGVCFFVLI